MEQLKHIVSQMVKLTETEFDGFIRNCNIKRVIKNEFLYKPPNIPNEIYFVLTGILRMFVIDTKGVEHTIHFILENQFISDYANFLQKSEGCYYLQALEQTEVIVFSREQIEWGYKNAEEGNKLGRLIAEHYFIIQSEHIKNTYLKTAKERYDNMSLVYPNIHQRVAQHHIASYIGVTPIHLSRLKKMK